MAIKLIRLSKEYRRQLFEMMDEWKALKPDEHTPWAIFKNDYHDFDYYLANLDLKQPKEGKVPDTVLFAYDEDRDIFVGAVNIRHYLNEGLLATGGHIGDGIRPSERRKGYGNLIVSLALKECRKLGIDKVLMTCDKTNVASRRTIINNGGILENEVSDGDEVVQRFWIDL